MIKISIVITIEIMNMITLFFSFENPFYSITFQYASKNLGVVSFFHYRRVDRITQHFYGKYVMIGNIARCSRGGEDVVVATRLRWRISQVRFFFRWEV